jgi:hypothetical protein
MKELLRLVALTMLGICVLAAGRVEAQVSQNGPYYANPSWDQQLPASTRFVVLTNWSSEAVLDRETGLVWQRSPSGFSANWFDALEFCNFFTFTGNRGGWRLPSIQELQSLIDPTQRYPALPAGNPFQGVQFVGNSVYWAAATNEQNPTQAWAVLFAAAGTSVSIFKTDTSTTNFIWCVRGGQGLQNPQ